MKKWNERSKRNKALLLTSIVAIGIIGGGTAVFATEKNKQEKAKIALVETTETLDQEEKKINALFLESNPNFLKKDIGLKDIEEVKISKGKVSFLDNDKQDDLTKRKKELEIKLAKATEMYQLQTSVNELFQTDYLNGNEENASVVVKDDLDGNTVTDLQNKIKESKLPTEFLSTLEKGTTEAQVQLETNQQATDKVENLYTEGNVREGVSREDYQSAFDSVGNIKNEKKKQELSQKLVAVLQAIEAKEQEQVVQESEKREEGKIQEQVQSNSTGQNATQSNGTASGSTGGGGSNYSSPSQTGNGGGNNYTAPNTPSSGGAGSSQNNGSSGGSTNQGGGNTYVEDNRQGGTNIYEGW